MTTPEEIHLQEEAFQRQDGQILQSYSQISKKEREKKEQPNPIYLTFPSNCGKMRGQKGPEGMFIKRRSNERERRWKKSKLRPVKGSPVEVRNLVEIPRNVPDTVLREEGRRTKKRSGFGISSGKENCKSFETEKQDNKSGRCPGPRVHTSICIVGWG